VAGSCEYDDEPSGSGATELVISISIIIIIIWSSLMSATKLQICFYNLKIVALYVSAVYIVQCISIYFIMFLY
jgi:hypothetical protein